MAAAVVAVPAPGAEAALAALVVLVINLREAAQRWANVVAGAAAALPPGVRVERIDAVHWQRDLSPDLAEVEMTPLARALVLHRGSQGLRRADHRQMDTPSSVAILLSHLRAWAWLADHPDVPHALVLEDDACLRPSPVWAAAVAPALAAAAAAADADPGWDVLVLGYFAPRGRSAPRDLPGTPPAAGDPGAWVTADHFFGAHAYVVTQRGARVLRAHALPVNEQADGLLLTLAQLGRLRVFLLARSLVDQCLNAVDRAGSWHTHTTIRVAAAGPRLRWAGAATAALLLLLLLAGGWWWWWWWADRRRRRLRPLG